MAETHGLGVPPEHFPEHSLGAKQTETDHENEIRIVNRRCRHSVADRDRGRLCRNVLCERASRRHHHACHAHCCASPAVRSVPLASLAGADWFVTCDPNDEARRLFVPTRTNFCVEPRGLGFFIESGRVVWDIADHVDSQDPLQNLSGSALWLSQLLAEGDVHSQIVYRLGGECGYTRDRLKNAGRRIGVYKHRIGFGNDGQWK